MNRREVLQRSAAVLGYTLTGPVLAGLMEGCKAKPQLNYKPQFLNEDQAALISELSEVIIPKTDTAGAIDAGVPAFIDGMLFEVYPAAAKENFMKGLAAFNDEAKKAYGDDFAVCTVEQKNALVKKSLDDLGGALDTSTAWYKSGKKEKPFIIEMKELTLVGYFTSEPGATQTLQYNQVPGPFKGCVPVAEVGKTWAT
ncbi:MAG: gluconate 2-dehydrogenase subunit 3 family protein [Chthoniobacteraceae bacterium]